MIDTTIYLEGVDPVDFFGVNNLRFEKIKSHKLSQRADPHTLEFFVNEFVKLAQKQ